MGKGRCFTKQFSFVLKININSDSESVKKKVCKIMKDVVA